MAEEEVLIAINRLARSYKAFSEGPYASGHTSGQEWVRNRAKLEELVRMRNLIGNDFPKFKRGADKNGVELFEWFAINVGGFWYEYREDDYWRDLLDSGEAGFENEEFVLGFIEASLGFFNDHYEAILAISEPEPF
jgi:hypothetical protein